MKNVFEEGVVRCEKSGRDQRRWNEDGKILRLDKEGNRAWHGQIK